MIEMKKVPDQGGLFITFEGIDGSGKTVQAAALLKNLRQRGYVVTLVRDPGGPSVSEEIRDILLDRRHHLMTPLTELFLYEAARSQLVSDIIRPALNQGEIVISDRFTDSSVAYQGYGRSIPPELIQNANRWACGETIPHRTYILDIPWEESVRRRSTSSEKTDRLENEREHFYQKVREGYQTIANQEPHRVQLLDGTKSIGLLEQEILQDTLNILDRSRVEKVPHKKNKGVDTHEKK